MVQRRANQQYMSKILDYKVQDSMLRPIVLSPRNMHVKIEIPQILVFDLRSKVQYPSSSFFMSNVQGPCMLARNLDKTIYKYKVHGSKIQILRLRPNIQRLRPFIEAPMSMFCTERTKLQLQTKCRQNINIVKQQLRSVYQ